MKKLFAFLLLPLTLLGVEYEFLTPQTVVLKNPKPHKYTSHEVERSGVWKKENALLRDKKGNILRKPDTTYYNFITFKMP